MTITLNTKPANSRCPCGKADMLDLQRIPRPILVKTFLFWLPLKRYKCMNCLKKKWLRG